jgi:hypothetical protein
MVDRVFFLIRKIILYVTYTTLLHERTGPVGARPRESPARSARARAPPCRQRLLAGLPANRRARALVSPVARRRAHERTQPAAGRTCADRSSYVPARQL